jgi:hypothetical protein
VSVTGVNDAIDDGDVAYSIVLRVATGGGYAGINPVDVAIVNRTGPAEKGACTHDFSDVDGSNNFEDDICWLADHGITKGCNPPSNTQFCPEDPVTRGQMAAFLVPTPPTRPTPTARPAWGWSTRPRSTPPRGSPSLPSVRSPGS